MGVRPVAKARSDSATTTAHSSNYNIMKINYTTDRWETKETRLGGGLFDPTTRDKTAPASCVLEDTPIDHTYQPQCRLRKNPLPPQKPA